MVSMAAVGDLDSIVHPKFKYVFVPAEINEPIQVLEYAGQEGVWKESMRTHFAQQKMSEEDRAKFRTQIKKEMKDKSKHETDLRDADLDAAVASQSYEIVPLCLPSKKNNFLAVNMYIDHVGRVKDLPLNARATRISSKDIRGDCFVSATFDDDDEFKRIDFTGEMFEAYLRSPPESVGWNQADVFANMMMQQQGQAGPGSAQQSAALQKMLAGGGSAGAQTCGNCGKTLTNPSRCARCKTTHYCNAECQKNDWKSHKRVCKPA